MKSTRSFSFSVLFGLLISSTAFASLDLTMTNIWGTPGLSTQDYKSVSVYQPTSKTLYTPLMTVCAKENPRWNDSDVLGCKGKLVREILTATTDVVPQADYRNFKWHLHINDAELDWAKATGMLTMVSEIETRLKQYLSPNAIRFFDLSTKYLENTAKLPKKFVSYRPGVSKSPFMDLLVKHIKSEGTDSPKAEILLNILEAIIGDNTNRPASPHSFAQALR